MSKVTSILLYVFLFMTSVTLLGLTAYRTRYTKRLDSVEILANRRHFYNPVVVELLVTSIFALILSLLMIAFLAGELVGKAGTYVEIASLSVLFVMFLVGAAIFTSDFSNLAWCRSFRACRILETIKAFSWICWGLVVLLLLLSIYRLFKHKGSRGTSRSNPETRTAATSQPATTSGPALA